MMNISQVATVFAPVADLDLALTFYVDTLGWRKKVDFTRDDEDAPVGYRLVKVSPAGSRMNVALLPAAERTDERTDRTLCALVSSDIDADHAALVAAGLDVETEVVGQGGTRPGLIGLDVTVSSPTPRQFAFRDPDGNKVLVVHNPDA
jgi:catechol 2,3-dioxygenase-like lactoylglutathione lyase family enzyme